MRDGTDPMLPSSAPRCLSGFHFIACSVAPGLERLEGEPRRCLLQAATVGGIFSFLLHNPRSVNLHFSLCLPFHSRA